MNNTALHRQDISSRDMDNARQQNYHIETNPVPQLYLGDQYKISLYNVNNSSSFPGPRWN